jgi:hypothetical protein
MAWDRKGIQARGTAERQKAQRVGTGRACGASIVRALVDGCRIITEALVRICSRCSSLPARSNIASADADWTGYCLGEA